ncbi:MAG: metal ABC transporter substrate-binding protein [Candidatus Electryonea clarkiae]|nr:metal ABC transporter substrate-binding protein [Candidatus Electryonea clarkiae]MDP8289012.1 metal ABC transporter substrate-binding protein [Candidatus Electryonea clarkiae]
MKLKPYIIILISALLGMAGCLKEIPKNENEDEIVILATFLPVYCFVDQVAGGLPGVKVEILAEGEAANPHHFNLRPGDMKKISQADIIVRHGLSIDSFLDKKILKSSGASDSSALITLVEGIPPQQLLGNLKGKSFDRDIISSGSTAWDTLNPHVWVSPTKASIMARYLSRELAKLLPVHHDSLIIRGNRYSLQLDSLADRYKDAIRGSSNNLIVTQHNSMFWLARDTGLSILGAIEKVGGADPGPRAFYMFEKEIKRNPPIGIFVDPNVPSNLAESVSLNTNVTIYPFDPVGRGTVKSGKYLETMQNNLSILMDALAEPS